MSALSSWKFQLETIRVLNWKFEFEIRTARMSFVWISGVWNSNFGMASEALDSREEQRIRAILKKNSFEFHRDSVSYTPSSHTPVFSYNSSLIDYSHILVSSDQVDSIRCFKVWNSNGSSRPFAWTGRTDLSISLNFGLISAHSNSFANSAGNSILEWRLNAKFRRSLSRIPILRSISAACSLAPFYEF